MVGLREDEEGRGKMNIDALLEDYMKNPKWAGKIFMQDEKPGKQVVLLQVP